ncbi:hypothetical protein [Methanothermobacter wolfeii]|jgi:hypothetical protein|uniref:hypothetical protein n=1 Tax=Methanothermobacter wolfeii TaxID=145261 RepID=UPI0024B3C57C|nr:hypothetical protein [Methanothermobacter wolfeii]MDI6702602.1 hypothetical protein [Methanothermobacter wolfeii]MDI6841819.1 hypothetical protein [Methanothermobacter wolfeii]
MIIARPEWFGRRKYGGWGVSIKTWQGALYLASIIMLILLIQLLPLEAIARLYVTGAWLLFVFIDMFDVMWKVQRDEREYIHEAIAERNAAWAMMPILVVGMFIELILSSLRGEPRVNPFIALALIAGVVAKSVTNYRLEKEN